MATYEQLVTQLDALVAEALDKLAMAQRGPCGIQSSEPWGESASHGFRA